MRDPPGRSSMSTLSATPGSSYNTELEALLVVSKIVSVDDQAPTSDSSRPAPAKDDDRSDDDEDDRKPPRRISKPVNGKIRGRTTVEDDDSDFDL